MTVSNSMPIVEKYDALIPVAEKLYTHMDHLAQIMLLPLFLLSILCAYSQDLGLQGAVVSRMKKLVITALLLAAFPTLSNFIKDLGQQIALSIDNLQGLDEFLKKAGEKSQHYSGNVTSLLEMGNNFLVQFFVSASFLLLFFARYLLVAYYHFYWLFLVVTAPLVILGTLFEATSNLPKNLFKSMTLVACWPIVWAILSAFLAALPFADAYKIDGGYNSIIVMNLILTVALLFSPFLLSSFCEGLIVGSGSTLHSGAKALVGFAMPKAGLAMNWAGAKAQPFVRPYVSAAQKLGGSAIKYVKEHKNSLRLIPLLFALSANAESTAINLQPGKVSVLCFESKPEYASLGDARYFQATKLGDKLLVKATKPNKNTNLLVFFKHKNIESFSLSSNLILPHTESLKCEKKVKGSTERKPVAKSPIIVQRTASSSITLKSYTWNNRNTRDVLSLLLELKNNGDSRLKPKWSRIKIEAKTGAVLPTKVFAERKQLEPKSKIKLRLLFRNSGLSSNSGAELVIPSDAGDLKLNIKKGVFK